MSGRLTDEVKTNDTSSGGKVAHYRIAVEKRFKREGQPSANFFNCVAFGKTAEFAEKYLKKGMKVIINGELNNDNFKNKDGQMVYRDVIVVSNHEFCESKRSDNGGEAAPAKESKPPVITEDANGFMNIPEGVEEELPFN